MFHLGFVAGSLQGHWWGFISRNYVVWPIFFLTNVFIALNGIHFLFQFHSSTVFICVFRYDFDQIHIDMFYKFVFPIIYTQSHKTYALVTRNITTLTAFVLIFFQHLVNGKLVSDKKALDNSAPFKCYAIHNGPGPSGPGQCFSVPFDLLQVGPKTTPGKSVLNNTLLHTSALYKAILNDSALGNLDGIIFSQYSSLQEIA